MALRDVEPEEGGLGQRQAGQRAAQPGQGLVIPVAEVVARVVVAEFVQQQIQDVRQRPAEPLPPEPAGVEDQVAGAVGEGRQGFM